MSLVGKILSLDAASHLLNCSIVILIIGIAIAGIFTGNYLFNKAILTTARSLTNSSPIATNKDLVLWLESSSLLSFKEGETSDGTQITSWNSINTKMDVTISPVSPVYANTINRIPAIRFTGNNYVSVDGNFLQGNEYTILVVEQRESGNSNNYFIGDSSISSSNQNLLIGYNSSGNIIHSQAGTSAASNSNSYAASVSDYSANNPKIFIITNSASAGKKIYINGILAATSTDTSKISNLNTLYIGKGYTGQIGEIAVFTSAMSSNEITDIFTYTAKKWSIKTKASTSSEGIASCIGGTIDNSGNCIGTCPINIVGISNSTVNPGSSSLTCNQAGYTGTVNYNCSGGTANITGSCSCNSGYTLVSGVCQQLSGCYQVSEGSSIKADAPSGKSWKGVMFASYGTPNNCSIDSNCHSSASFTKVYEACVGKSSCTISADNGTFGDPCSTVGKRLHIKLTY